MDKNNNYKETLRRTPNINFKHSIGNINIFGNRFHTWYELFLLIRGDAEFNSKKDIHKVQNKELIIIPPATYHQFIVTGKYENYERCILEFNDNCSERVNVKECLEGKEIILLSEDSIIYQDFMKIIEYTNPKYKDEFNTLLKSLTEEIVINIKHNVQDKNNVSYTNRLSPVTAQIIDFIDEHLTDNIHIEDISKKLFVSPSTICHTFKKDLGVSILQYITQKRMILAKRLIENGAKPSVACSSVGYVDYSTFYRNYRKEFKLGPSKKN